jgi:hypothetical protein
MAPQATLSAPDVRPIRFVPPDLMRPCDGQHAGDRVDCLHVRCPNDPKAKPLDVLVARARSGGLVTIGDLQRVVARHAFTGELLPGVPDAHRARTALESLFDIAARVQAKGWQHVGVASEWHHDQPALWVAVSLQVLEAGGYRLASCPQAGDIE